MNQSKPRRLSRSAFTLLEMVAAMVLMTILFAALTSLLRSFADQGRSLDRFAENNPPTQQLADLLRRDLIHARLVRSDQRSLTLVGNLAQDWTTRLHTGQRAEITYRIDTIAGEPWLIRREVHLDAVSTQQSREEPLWRGANGIDLIAASEIGMGEGNETSANFPGMSAMPARLQLIMRRDNSKPLIQLNVVHHWEDN